MRAALEQEATGGVKYDGELAATGRLTLRHRDSLAEGGDR
jgi:hypothetical protein